MATLECVTAMIAAWHEAYPTRELTRETAAVWARTFPDVSDGRFTAAGFVLMRQPDRKFFPTPGELEAVLRAGGEPALSAPELLQQISRLGQRNPQGAWVFPRVETVRGIMGEVVAAAYGFAGGNRLNSDSPTTREIAERDFATALERERAAAARAPQPPRLAIGAGEGAPALPRDPAVYTAPMEVSRAIDEWYAQRESVSKRVQPPPS